MRVFLGGTCNKSTWRDLLISQLPSSLSYFNPVVDNWTPEHLANELREREICDIIVYAITPKMKGIYSIAEAVDDSNKRPSKTVFAILPKDGLWSFKESTLKSLHVIANMLARNGASTCVGMSELVATITKMVT